MNSIGDNPILAESNTHNKQVQPIDGNVDQVLAAQDLSGLRGFAASCLTALSDHTPSDDWVIPLILEVIGIVFVLPFPQDQFALGDP